MPAYAGSKAGVRIYGESLRALLAPRGVRVSVVVPGFFESAMTDRFHGAKPLMIPLDAAVAKVRRGIDRGAARIVFPRRVALMMQVTDVLPAALGDAILRANRFRIEHP
jgi:NAD(P)-dependent dehydrogenase (short-subunit alcohol dehydrogenase family)